MRKAATLVVVAVVLFAALALLTRPRPPEPVPEQKQMAKQTIEPRPVPQEPAAPQLKPQPEPDAREKREAPVAQRPELGLGRCVLYGTVTDPEGNPAGGVRAVIVRTKEGTNRIPVKDMPIGETMTLDDGSYRFENLPDGFYVVCAIAQQACGSGAGLLDWDTETRREAKLDIGMKPVIPTSGTVWNARGEPVEGASIAVVVGTGHAPVISKLMPAKTDEGGRYTLTYLWGGRYSIEASAEGYAPSLLEDVHVGNSENDLVLYAGASVSGTVMFKHTGEPARGVPVLAKHLRKGRDRETITDDAGKYLLERLSRDAAYAITVKCDDYTALEIPIVGMRAHEARSDVDTLFPIVLLEDGDVATGVDILLSKGSSISGTVTVSETGEPLSGTKVSISGASFFASRQATSGMDGTYTCGLLPAGSYAVECHPPEGVAGGRSHRSKRVVLVAPEESVAGVDFSFRKGVSVSGCVMDSNMDGIEGAALLAKSWGGGPYRVSRATSDAKGDYKLTGMAGASTYRLFAEAKGYANVYRQIRVPTEGEVTGIDIVLEHGATISGCVVDTNRRPLSNAEISLAKEPGEKQLLPGPAISDEEGRFEIGNVAAGSYRFRVEVRGIDRRYSRMARNDPIAVRSGEEIADVEVLVDAAEEQVIEGYARNEQGDGIPGVTVRASGRDLGSRTETDLSGAYRLRGLGEEMVTLSFRHGSYADAWLREVAVGATDADIVMYRRGGISGAVMDAVTRTRLEVFDVAVTRLQANDGITVPTRSRGHRREDPEVGTFLMKDVTPGLATLQVSAPGYAPQEVSDIVVMSGQVTSGVDVYLSRPAVIEGYVTENGVPVSSVKVEIGGSDSCATDENGYYEHTGLGSGTYMVSVSLRSETQSAFVRTRPGYVSEKDFEFRTGSAAIEGYITLNGEPASNGQVAALPRSDPEQMPDQVNADANGFYRIEGLAEDAYTVVARAHDPASGSDMARSVHVELKNREALRVDIDISGSCTITGTVSSPREYSLPMILVRDASATDPVSFDELPALMAETVANIQCRRDEVFEITNLPPGSYKVTALCLQEERGRLIDLIQESRTVTVKEGQVVELSFAL